MHGISAQEADAIKRSLAGRDPNVRARPYVPKSNPAVNSPAAIARGVSVVSTVVKSKAGRPKQDPVIAEREALIRIAVRGSNILATLCQPGRGRYDSERQLGRWLTSDATPGPRLSQPGAWPFLRLPSALYGLLRLLRAPLHAWMACP
jgi:hypothetical protein